MLLLELIFSFYYLFVCCFLSVVAGPLVVVINPLLEETTLLVIYYLYMYKMELHSFMMNAIEYKFCQIGTECLRGNPRVPKMLCETLKEMAKLLLKILYI